MTNYLNFDLDDDMNCYKLEPVSISAIYTLSLAMCMLLL